MAPAPPRSPHPRPADSARGDGASGLRITVLEPYDAISHRLHWEGLAAHSRHTITVHSLPARLWKFRMRTASFHFAELLSRAAAAGESPPDLLVCSEYLSVAEMIPLLPRAWRGIPVVVDFHENQLTYPLRPGESRDLHFAFSHLHAGIVSERAIFHSTYHRDEFLAALPGLIRPVPDVDLRSLPRRFAERSTVLPLASDAPAVAPRLEGTPRPTILWAHRFEYDKGPEAFVGAVERLRSAGESFRVRVLGQRFREEPLAFRRLAALLGDDLSDDGFLPDRGAYLAAVASADIALSTADHEFFGVSTLEALRSGLVPVLPDDLAYPELLPESARRPPFLYSRGDDTADAAARALAQALAIVRSGEEKEVRSEIARETDRFRWEEIAPRYDALFAEVVGDAE